MVTLNLNVDISNFTEKQDSIVEIYLNEGLIGEYYLCDLN